MNDTVSGALKSRTMWFNSIVAGFGVVAASTDALKGVVPEQYFPLAIALIAAINMGLRTQTTTSLEDK
jgi:hypothetical protein